ncbi:gll2197 [Gloeobacter violaceus PCC 7421]|uniref:Gll2197 protein n=2 Tax=Gloeobacter violaceus TaxID=33072 RepID=Q7NII6_GLOVI|nr:gll2197 [Gloeobacter violaceus PCC 7421]
MKNVGICRMVFPCVSETFIVEQASHLRRYHPTFVVARLLREVPFDNVKLTAASLWGWQERLFWLTRQAGGRARHEALRRLPLLHAHFGRDGVYALALAEAIDIPLVVTYHGFDATASPLALWCSRGLMNYQFLLHEAALQRRAAAIIAVSDFIRERLLAKGCPPEKIIRHYIGIDTAKFTPAERPADERYILCVGRHAKRKGIDVLIEAFARIAARHPEVALVQIGAGALTGELQALARRLGVAGRVRFLGAQPHARVIEWMRGAEIFSLPSRTSRSGDSEALGIVFNEASACAVPVVSTRHGGIPEAILDGETGLLAPEGDAVALAEKLDILLADRGLGRRLGLRGREFVCEQFDIDTQTAKLEAVYDRFAA